MSAELLRRPEESLLQPEVRKSEKAVADLLADDFLEFGGGRDGQAQAAPGQPSCRERRQAAQVSTTTNFPKLIDAIVCFPNPSVLAHQLPTPQGNNELLFP